MMIWIFLVFLFIMQLIGFYFIALVFTKVSNFDDLEKKQRKLMTEMDDSIAAYLAELKDENERLIASLAATQKSEKTDRKKSEESISATNRSTASTLEESPPAFHIAPPKIPINLALKSYATTVTQKEETKPEKAEVIQADNDVRTKVFNLHDTGLANEAIAKKLGVGQTEVELILKFR